MSVPARLSAAEDKENNVDSQPNAYVTRSKRSVFAAAVVSVLMLFVGVPRLHADDEFAECRHKTEKAEAKLDEAIAKHGKHSHETAERTEDLRKQRETCYDHIHEWWDGRDQKWQRDDDFGKHLHHRGDRDDDDDRPDSK